MSELKNGGITSVSLQGLSIALVEVLKITETQAKELIAYFTFDGNNNKQTLWQRPLLKQGDGLLLVWLPLIGSHPMHLIAEWAKEAKHLEVINNKRGLGFEVEVATVLSAAIQQSSFCEDAFVFRSRIEMPDRKIGDIDVILILGDTAFVLECRNLMHPATPHEFWSVAYELNEKIDQVVRKRNYLFDNPAILSGLIAESPFSQVNRKINKVVGVVVSNSYLFEGVSDVEPYFVHVDTLFNTILTGGPLFGDMGDDGREITLHVDYFKPNVPPSETLIRAIAKPAKAEFYRQCINRMDFPIPAVDQTEPYGIFSKWVFTPPETGALRSMLNKCSFASDIVTKFE
ncbi:hypothetical protein [Iodobacter ciconiae]|uniref:NERD domain-containing protein n=1 Tax=Iodobacter ciconiae TaxID=2496266 RepID=A0A3S8ZNU1_9NEIS|nr:hypothetical protein [Iodobacter ciconiae]AZN35145.1 hypothetical protein EJO50_00775 [Iodobacter ciconiae]